MDSSTRDPASVRVSLMERMPEWSNWALALAAAMTASVLCLSTVLAAFSGEQIGQRPGTALLLAPGDFLIGSLSWAAMLVPLYLYAVAYAVGRPADQRLPSLHVALPVAVLIIPIVASLSHILTMTDPPPFPAALVGVMGRPTSVLLLFVLLLTAGAAVVLLSGISRKLGLPVALLTPPEPAHAAPAPEPEPEPAPAPAGRFDEAKILQSREPFMAILAAAAPAVLQ